MRGHRTSLAVALALVLLVTTGCLSDRQRTPLDMEWDAQASLSARPIPIAGEVPTQLFAEATLGDTGGRTIEMTGVSADVTVENQTRGLRAVLLRIDGQRHDPLDSDTFPLALNGGERIRMGFAPATVADARLPANTSLPTHVELRWRFQEADAFDAGRLVFDGNLTARAVEGLGSGVAELSDGRLERLVFPHTRGGPVVGQVEVAVYQIGPTGAEERSPISAVFSTGEGVVFGDPTPKLRLPDGVGYLVLVPGDDVGGVVLVPLDRPQERTPAPGALLILAILAAMAATAGRSGRR